MKKISPFEVEKERHRLASSRDYKNLNKLYSTSLPEIKDINTPNFWDKRYKNENSIVFQDPMTRDRIKKVVNYIPSSKNLSLLNIAAGFGWLEELLRNYKVDLWSNDFSPVAVKYLKSHFKGNFSVKSVYNLSYNRKFDVITILEVLEHIPPSKTMKVLKSINGLMRQKGLLIVSVPLNEGLENMLVNLNGHVRVYTKDLIIAELHMSGFKILEYEFLYAFSENYKIKTFISKILKNRDPNNIIIKAQKI